MSPSDITSPHVATFSIGDKTYLEIPKNASLEEVQNFFSHLQDDIQSKAMELSTSLSTEIEEKLEEQHPGFKDKRKQAAQTLGEYEQTLGKSFRMLQDILHSRGQDLQTGISNVATMASGIGIDPVKAHAVNDTPAAEEEIPDVFDSPSFIEPGVEAVRQGSNVIIAVGKVKPRGGEVYEGIDWNVNMYNLSLIVDGVIIKVSIS